MAGFLIQSSFNTGPYIRLETGKPFFVTKIIALLSKQTKTPGNLQKFILERINKARCKAPNLYLL
jgi:hypothetical protein